MAKGNCCVALFSVNTADLVERILAKLVTSIRVNKRTVRSLRLLEPISC